MGVHVKVAGVWQEIAAPESGFAWAKVSGGTVTEYTKPDGSVMEVHTFTAGGTLTVENAGYAEVLLVGGGSGGAANVFNGGGGSIASGIRALPSGSHPVTVGVGGAGGATNGESASTYGKVSSIGSVVATTWAYIFHGSGGTDADSSLPFTSSITGTPQTYGLKGQASARPNRGDGGNLSNTPGSSGVVIVAVQKSAALPLPPAGPWARVSGGTVTEVVNADGSVDEVHTFTADGSLTVESPGYARVLLCGTGGYGNAGIVGNAGVVMEGYKALPAGTLDVKVPEPSSGGTVAPAVRIGSVWATSLTPYANNQSGAFGVGAGSGYPPPADSNSGYTSDISGTPYVYGPLRDVTKFGGGAPEGVAAYGGKGVVIVRVQKSAPTVSGVAATGGTETTYTGDGVNGVLGQKYKVHTFTANGNLVVAQGGEADVLVCGSGVPGYSAAAGSGGRLILGPRTLSPGTFPVVVGVAPGVGADAGTASRLGDLIAAPVPLNTSGWAGAGAMATTASGTSPGVVSNISGAVVEYCAAGAGAGPGCGGAANGAARNGVVIVRYEIA